jgi:hypothetical protein
MVTVKNSHWRGGEIMRLTEPKGLHGVETRGSVGNVALGGGYLYIFRKYALTHCQYSLAKLVGRK